LKVEKTTKNVEKLRLTKLELFFQKDLGLCCDIQLNFNQFFKIFFT